MQTDILQLSKHAWFFREGDAYTVPGAGTAAVDSLPDGTDPAYISLGAIEEWDHDFAIGQDLETWRASPGKLVLRDSRAIKEKLTLKFTTGDMSPMALEAFYRSEQNLDDSSTQFNPLRGGLRRGWLHLEMYDQDSNDLVLTWDLWGRLRVAGGMKGGDGSIIKPNFELLVFDSDYNSAGIEV